MYGTSLELKAMKAWKLPKGKGHMKDEVCDSGEYFGQIKKDGYWYQFEKDSEGNCFLFSRVISEETGHLSEKSANVPHIINYLSDRLPNGTIIIGETYYPNKTSKDVTPIMGCLPEKAVDRQNNEYGLIHFYMHDIIMYAGQSLLSMDNLTRYCFLETIVCDKNLIEPEFMEFAPAITLNLSQAIDDAFEAGEEGTVLKMKKGLYQSGKKPAWNWIKFKIEDDHDVICLGFEPPKKEYAGTELKTWKYWADAESESFETFNGEAEAKAYAEKSGSPIFPVTKPFYNGWIGAIRIGVYKDGEIVDIGTVSSGLTDDLCEDIRHCKMDFLGKPLAVKCMQVGDDALRHPVFVNFRDDIPAEDCTWEKVFE